MSQVPRRMCEGKPVAFQGRRGSCLAAGERGTAGLGRRASARGRGAHIAPRFPRRVFSSPPTTFGVGTGHAIRAFLSRCSRLPVRGLDPRALSHTSSLACPLLPPVPRGARERRVACAGAATRPSTGAARGNDRGPVRHPRPWRFGGGAHWHAIASGWPSCAARLVCTGAAAQSICSQLKLGLLGTAQQEDALPEISCNSVLRTLRSPTCGLIEFLAQKCILNCFHGIGALVT